MAKNHPFFILTLFFSLLFFNSQAATYNDAYKLIIQLELDSAKTILDKLPETNQSLYLKNLHDAAHQVVFNNPDDYKERIKTIEKRIKALEKTNSKTPYYKYYIAESKLQLAFINILYQEKINAYFNFKASYNLIKENIEEYPDFIPHYKTYGLYKVIIGSIPKENQWVPDLLGFEGDIQKGYEYIDKVIHSSTLLKTEASLYKAMGLAFLDKNLNESIEILKTQNHQKNILARYLYCNTLIKSHKNNIAYPIIQNTTKKEVRKFPLFAYLQGESNLLNGNYSEAINKFNNYITINESTHHIKSSYFKIYCCYYIIGNKSEALNIKPKISSEGDSFYNTDKYANKYHERDLPPKNILKARFYYDGGNFDKALKILNSMSTVHLTQEEKTEYYYRKARIYEAQKDYKKALSLYKSTIEACPPTQNNPNYFAPQSCLNQAKILNKTGNKTDSTEAIKTLNAIFEYHSYDYEKSIKHEAKTLLKTLENN